MSPEMKIFIGVIAVITLVYAAACIYNSIFPKKYLNEKYPNAVIVSSDTHNGSIFNGIMVPSDFGYRYADYKLYDETENISFGQDFKLVWYFPFYRPVSPIDNFEVQLKHKNFVNQTLDDMKTITEKYAKDCTSAENPFDSYLNSGNCGCHIFIKYQTAENLAALIKKLDDYILKIRRSNYVNHISYSVFVCMDDEVYNRFAETDFSNAYAGYTGHAYFTDMLTAVPEFEATRITASNNGFSEKIYKNFGDRDDDEYQDPKNFDHLVFWYRSEPNAIGHQDFYLFGVNEKE